MRKAMLVFVLLAAGARGEQKNVKLLTGLSDFQLQRVMNLMRASMGTHCDYCHVLKEKWNFASDENPQKVRAREMIRMVMDINQKNFGGQPVVSCFTCHRGSPRPVNLAELPQAPPKRPGPPPEKPQLAEAKEVVAKYAAALGDASRLKLPRTLKGERIGAKTPTLLEVTENNGEIRVIADGKPVESDDWQRALDTAFLAVAPSDIGEGAKTIAKENEQWVVARGNERFYFDGASGLLTRHVVLTSSVAGTIPQQTDFEDYRDVGGTKFPFRIRVSFVDPWSSAARQYTAVEIGLP
jgi:hypothetical protein